jgi:hypothetical protein
MGLDTGSQRKMARSQYNRLRLQRFREDRTETVVGGVWKEALQEPARQSRPRDWREHLQWQRTRKLTAA